MLTEWANTQISLRFDYNEHSINIVICCSFVTANFEYLLYAGEGKLKVV